jgi:hypothetical protein
MLIVALFVHQELFPFRRPTHLRGGSVAIWQAVSIASATGRGRVLCLLDSGVERGKTEPADNVVRAIAPRYSISPAVAR